MKTDPQDSCWVDARLRESSFYERGWLDRFCALIPPGGSVLDIGCGAGEPIARYVSECGYAITGVDSSTAMIAKFRARLPGQQALVSDMRTLSLGRLFHGTLVWDSFFHLNHEDQRRMFPVFRSHAAPRAALMFTSGTAYGEAIGRLEGEPLYHASLDAAEYRKLLDDTGFDVVATVTEDPTCGGRTVWLAQFRHAIPNPLSA
ncbi:MAG: class I SAM-dependent methyltransferase [Rhodanobacteraceae bacterium]|nr:MAG: class I SAM-dependent methyltransferase [Rhodanobacteraceae bacterium]